MGAPPLGNDQLATAYVIKPSDGNHLTGQDNTGVTHSTPGAPTVSPGSALWYVWFPYPTDNGLSKLFAIAVRSGSSFDSYIRIYSGPAPVNGVMPTFSQLTQVAADDDSNIPPGAGDGWTSLPTYPNDNASCRFVIDSTKTYYIAAGGFSSNTNADWSLNFPQSSGGTLQPSTSVGQATVTASLSGGHFLITTPMLGKATVTAMLQRLLRPGTSAVTKTPDNLIRVDAVQSLQHTEVVHDLRTGIHITSTSSPTQLGGPVPLAGNSSVGRATVRGALAGTIPLTGTAHGATSIPTVKLPVARSLIATPLGKATITAAQVNQTPAAGTSMGSTSFSQGLPVLHSLVATSRGFAGVLHGPLNIQRALSAISRGTTVNIFRPAIDMRGTSLGKTTTTAKLSESYRLLATTSSGRTTIPNVLLTYQGGSQLGQLAVFARARVTGDLLNLIGMPAVQPSKGSGAGPNIPLSLKLAVHLDAVVRGAATVSWPRGGMLYAPRATSRGTAARPNQLLYRLLPDSLVSKGKGRLDVQMDVFLALQSARVVGRATVTYLEQGLDVIYGGLPAGDLLYHFMRPLPVTLVGQLWPRRHRLPEGVLA